jgi:hypothetical protein
MAFCDAPRSIARFCWATLSPDTDAMTAISAVQTAISTLRCSTLLVIGPGTGRP